MAVVENKVHLSKYLKVWKDLPKLKYIVIWNDAIPKDLPEEFKGKVFVWKDFLEIGRKFVHKTEEDNI